ncbi:MAG: PTS sugar transporter subunit IIA [Phycisphaerae bacterium]|nr:PTS sugar transporter subunit IIA [Phycisphaerae bacterium]
MPYSYMDMQALSRFLGMDIRKARKAAQRGDIPCQKVGGQLRFNRAEVTEWLQQQMGSMQKSNLQDLDKGIAADRETDATDMLISPLLRNEAICVDLHARTKKSVLSQLTKLAESTGLLWDSEGLNESLIQREELCSTAMPGGIAIPHPRKHDQYMQEDTILVIARTGNGIGFGSPDGGMTDLFFMLCSPDDRHHLHILARLCQMLYENDFVNQLRYAVDADEICNLMITREQEILAQH